MDAQEATEKLRTVQKVLTAFQAAYWTAQGKSGGLWKLHRNAPFDRLDAFLARCEDVLQMKIAVLQFGRLERIEVGGTQASLLQQELAHRIVSNAFADDCRKFHSADEPLTLRFACVETTNIAWMAPSLSERKSTPSPKQQDLWQLHQTEPNDPIRTAGQGPHSCLSISSYRVLSSCREAESG